MAHETDDIFPPYPDDIDRDLLIRYLRGELSPEDQHRVEAAMIESELISDAVDGLRDIDGKKLSSIQTELDAKVKKYLKARERPRRRKRMKDLPWTIIFIVMVLALILVAAVIIYLRGAL